MNVLEGMDLSRGPCARTSSQPACALLTENHERQKQRTWAGLFLSWQQGLSEPLSRLSLGLGRGHAFSRSLHSLCLLPGLAVLPPERPS